MVVVPVRPISRRPPNSGMDTLEEAKAQFKRRYQQVNGRTSPVSGGVRHKPEPSEQTVAGVLKGAALSLCRYFADRCFKLDAGRVVQTLFELAQDRRFGMTAHADNEGDVEFLTVRIIELVKPRKFWLRQPVEAGEAQMNCDEHQLLPGR
jgi:hypothetical protein